MKSKRSSQKDPIGAVQVKGESGETYWIFTEDALRIRDAVQKGLDDIKAGKVGPWDSEEIRREGRRRLKLEQERLADAKD